MSCLWFFSPFILTIFFFWKLYYMDPFSTSLSFSLPHNLPLPVFDHSQLFLISKNSWYFSLATLKKVVMLWTVNLSSLPILLLPTFKLLKYLISGAISFSYWIMYFTFTGLLSFQHLWFLSARSSFSLRIPFTSWWCSVCSQELRFCDHWGRKEQGYGFWSLRFLVPILQVTVSYLGNYPHFLSPELHVQMFVLELPFWFLVLRMFSSCVCFNFVCAYFSISLIASDLHFKRNSPNLLIYYWWHALLFFSTIMNSLFKC